MMRIRLALIALAVSSLTAEVGYADGSEWVGGYNWTFWAENYVPVHGGVAVAGRDMISPTPTGMVEVPASLGGYPVAVLNHQAFASNSSITMVTIPASVKEIGQESFCGCVNLRTVTFLGDCPKVPKVENSVDVDDGWVFYDTPEDLTVYVYEDARGWPSGNRWFGKKLVRRPRAPAGTETWYDATTGLTWEYCLDGGATMKRQQPAEYGALPPGATIEQVSPSPVGALEIPSSINGHDVVAIDQNFLKQCETITSVSVPSTVREISCYAFYDCKNLREIRLSEGLELIAWKAFNRFKGPSVTLPSTLSVLFTAVLTDASVSQTVTFLGEVPKVVETHGNVLVFEGRPNLIVLVPRNKGWEEIVSMGTWQGSLIRYAGTSPQVGSLEVIPGEAILIDTGLVGYTAKMLPSGLKYNKKTGKITGAAKKPTGDAGVTVTFTKKGEPDVTMTFVVDPVPAISVTLEGDTEKCKVTGGNKAYLVGKKVSLMAKGPKGTAFVGWFRDGVPWPSEEAFLEPKIKYVMTAESLNLVAWFKAEEVSVACDISAGCVVKAPVSFPVIVDCESRLKAVSAKKLPSGLKYNKKTGCIEGAAKKAGTYPFSLTVTTKAGSKVTQGFELVVADADEGDGGMSIR